MTDRCPCGSGQPYPQCCHPFIAGTAQAPTAETLMRSRYSAYTTDSTDYLRRSWHPDTCPPDLAPDPRTKWIGLEILATRGGGPDDDTGMVEFVARYKVGGRAHRLHERSRFVRYRGHWVYLDGEFESP